MTQRPRFLTQFAGLAVLSLGVVMFAQDSADRLVNPDAVFAVKAAQGNMAEIKMGELAAQKASNADVKAFGQQMVTDHTKANDELNGGDRRQRSSRLRKPR